MPDVEDKKRLPDGVHDGLSECSGIFVFDERLIVLHYAPLCDWKQPAAIRRADGLRPMQNPVSSMCFAGAPATRSRTVSKNHEDVRR